MKIVREKIVKNKRRVFVELDEGEEIIAIKPGRYYKLGYPIEDVMPAHVMQDVVEVVWDCISQEWITT